MPEIIYDTVDMGLDGISSPPRPADTEVRDGDFLLTPITVPIVDGDVLRLEIYNNGWKEGKGGGKEKNSKRMDGYSNNEYKERYPTPSAWLEAVFLGEIRPYWNVIRPYWAPMDWYGIQIDWKD